MGRAFQLLAFTSVMTSFSFSPLYSRGTSPSPATTNRDPRKITVLRVAGGGNFVRSTHSQLGLRRVQKSKCLNLGVTSTGAFPTKPSRPIAPVLIVRPLSTQVTIDFETRLQLTHLEPLASEGRGASPCS